MQWMGMGEPPAWRKAACAVGILAVAALTGCANPGAPQPPSLHLPALVRGMTAERQGDVVTLHFTVPQRTTDNLPVRESEVAMTLCREVEHGGCVAVSGVPARVTVKGPAGVANGVTVADRLPVALTLGPPRLVAYRVELRNAAGKSAGFSEPAFAVGGQAPAAVEGLTAQGSRLGVVLAWSATGNDSGTLYLRRREEHAAANGRGSQSPAGVLLRFDPASQARGERLVDTAAAEDVPYMYSAYREQRVTLGSHALVERSDESAPVAFTLRDVFPPPVPSDVTAAPVTAESGAYSVDLIWQPVDEPELAGYNVYRETLSAGGQAAQAREKLTATPVPQPAFHDATAQAGVGYRWTVTAVDHKGNESGGATVVLGAETRS